MLLDVVTLEKTADTGLVDMTEPSQFFMRGSFSAQSRHASEPEVPRLLQVFHVWQEWSGCRSQAVLEVCDALGGWWIRARVKTRSLSLVGDDQPRCQRESPDQALALRLPADNSPPWREDWSSMSNTLLIWLKRWTPERERFWSAGLSQNQILDTSVGHQEL